MSNEDEEMSDEELDSLLSDLEARAGDTSGDVPEEELEEMEKMLAEDDGGGGGESVKTETAPKAADAGPDLSEFDLDEADEMPVETGGGGAAAEDQKKAQKKARQQKKAKKKKAAADKKQAQKQKKQAQQEAGPSGAAKAARIAWKTTKWAAYVVPVMALWWLVGAYLGQWVSAGWLIFLVAGAFTFGVPFGAYRAAKNRGKYRWWLSGAGLGLTLLLTVPMVGTAGTVIAQYGHWPATTVDSIFGWDNSALTRASAGTSEWLGRTMNPALTDQETKVQLGHTPPSKPADATGASGGE